MIIIENEGKLRAALDEACTLARHLLAVDISHNLDDILAGEPGLGLMLFLSPEFEGKLFGSTVALWIQRLGEKFPVSEALGSEAAIRAITEESGDSNLAGDIATAIVNLCVLSVAWQFTRWLLAAERVEQPFIVPTPLPLG